VPGIAGSAETTYTTTYIGNRSSELASGELEQQLLEAREREQRRRELDPEGFRARRREVDRRYRERVAATGLTFTELHRRVGGDRATYTHVLVNEDELDYAKLVAR